MMRTFTLIGLLAMAACSRGADKERWQAPPTAARRIELTVTADGFQPSPVTIKAGEPVDLVITRKTDKTCATEIVIPGYGIEQKLPLDQAVTINLTPKQSGELVYGCAMDQMVRGVLQVQ